MNKSTAYSYGFFALLLLLATAVETPLLAKKIAYTYKSDSIAYRRGLNEVKLTGNASVKLKDGKVLEADQITIHEDRTTIIAKKKVRFVDKAGDFYFDGKSLTYNYGTEEFWSSERGVVQKPNRQTTIRGNHFHGKVKSDRLLVKTNVIIDSLAPDNTYKIYGQEANLDAKKGVLLVKKQVKVVQSNMNAYASVLEHNETTKELRLSKRAHIEMLDEKNEKETIIKAENVLYSYADASAKRYTFRTNVSISNTKNSNLIMADWVEHHPDSERTFARSNASLLSFEEELLVRATSLEQRPKENLFVAIGNVEIKSLSEADPFLVKGATATYDQKKGLMEVETNCSLQQPDMKATSERLTYNKETKETWLKGNVAINLLNEGGDEVETTISAGEVQKTFKDEALVYVFKDEVSVDNQAAEQTIAAEHITHLPNDGYTLAETNAVFRDEVDSLEVRAEVFEQFEAQNKLFAKSNVVVTSTSEADPYTIKGEHLRYERDIERVSVSGSDLKPCSVERPQMLAKAKVLVQDMATKDLSLEGNVAITTYDPATEKKHLSITAERSYRKERNQKTTFEFFEDVRIVDHLEGTTVTAGYVKHLPDEEYALAEQKPVLKRKQGDVVIKAEVLEQFGKEDLLYARGDAVITTEKTLSRSLLAIYNKKSKKVLLSGDCYLKSGKSEFISNRIYYSTVTEFAELRGVVRGSFQMKEGLGLFGNGDE